MTQEADPLLLGRARLGLFEIYREREELIWLQARGTSMLPTIRPGSWMRVQFGALPRGRGEIVVFTGRNEIIAHRVIAIRGDALLTKGDGSWTIDAPVALADVLGVVRAARRTPTARRRTFGCSGASATLAATLSAAHGRTASRLRAGVRRLRNG